MNEDIKKALIRQIKHSAVLLSVMVAFVLIWCLVYVLDSTYAYSFLLVFAIIIVPLGLYEFGWVLKGVFAIIDLIVKKTATRSLSVFGVFIEGYQGTKNSLYADIYKAGKDNKFFVRILPIKSCFDLRHDIILLGMPLYMAGHVYKIKFLKYSRLIVGIEDAGKDYCNRNELVKTSVSLYAESILNSNRYHS